MPKTSMMDRRNAEQKPKIIKKHSGTSVRLNEDELGLLADEAAKTGATQSAILRWCFLYIMKQGGVPCEYLVETTKKELRMP